MCDVQVLMLLSLWLQRQGGCLASLSHLIQLLPLRSAMSWPISPLHFMRLTKLGRNKRPKVPVVTCVVFKLISFSLLFQHLHFSLQQGNRLYFAEQEQTKQLMESLSSERVSYPLQVFLLLAQHSWVKDSLFSCQIALSILKLDDLIFGNPLVS
jgi:hypothetical protein